MKTYSEVWAEVIIKALKIVNSRLVKTYCGVWAEVIIKALTIVNSGD